MQTFYFSYPHYRLVSSYGQPKRYADKAEIVWDSVLAPDVETARQLIWKIRMIDPREVITADEWRKREKRFF